jgi:hypothetical protein
MSTSEPSAAQMFKPPSHSRSWLVFITIYFAGKTCTECNISAFSRAISRGPRPPIPQSSLPSQAPVPPPLEVGIGGQLENDLTLSHRIRKSTSEAGTCKGTCPSRHLCQRKPSNNLLESTDTHLRITLAFGAHLAVVVRVLGRVIERVE